MANLEISPAPAAFILVPCAAPAAALKLKHGGLTVNFRNHPSFGIYSKVFSSIVLETVTITVCQLSIPSSDGAYERLFFKYGLFPRDTPFLDDKREHSVAAYLPHMKSFATSTNPVDATFTWGVGGSPFPPGLQLDLASAEVTNKYPYAFLGHIDSILSKESDLEVSIQVDFNLKCSQQGFGAVF